MRPWKEECAAGTRADIRQPCRPDPWLPDSAKGYYHSPPSGRESGRVAGFTALGASADVAEPKRGGWAKEAGAGPRSLCRRPAVVLLPRQQVRLPTSSAARTAGQYARVGETGSPGRGRTDRWKLRYHPRREQRGWCRWWLQPPVRRITATRTRLPVIRPPPRSARWLHRQREPARALPQPGPRPRPARGPATELDGWMSTVGHLPALHAFIRGLRKDHAAIVAGLPCPYSDGPSEGANTKVKLLKRSGVRRRGLRAPRQRILLS